MSNIIQELENEQMAKLGKSYPDYREGDTVLVKVKVVEHSIEKGKEKTRERLQPFEGVVIAKRNRGLNSSFTVRKISNGEGVERVFQTYSNQIHSVTIKRRGHVRRAKLYYLRDLSGRKARIKEKLPGKNNKSRKTADASVATNDNTAVVIES